LGLLAGGKTDRGLSRKKNEDNFCVEEGLGLFAVADGMGGHAGGEVASTMAEGVLRDFIRKSGAGRGGSPQAPEMLASAVKFSGRAVYEAQEKNHSLRGMGTTMAAVLFDGGYMSVAHVGDSRVYLIRDGSITRLTEDHSLVSEQVSEGLISREEAERSETRNILTRALGQDPDVEVDFREFTVAHGDRVLLCTDGLTTMVSEDVILSTVNSHEDPQRACGLLVDRANESGGKDNVTAVLVCVCDRKWLLNLKKLLRWARR
jgi:protein phosphatase